MSFWLLAKNKFPNTPLKFYGPSCLLIARSTPISVVAPQQAKFRHS